MHAVILREELPIKIYEGKKALNIDGGHIVRIKQKPNEHTTDANSLLIRTTNHQSPFININTGSLWGDRIEEYIFEDLGKHSFSIIGK